MATSWRDYRDRSDGPDNSDKWDNSSAEPPNVANVTNVTGLPADIRSGLTFLLNAPVPRRVDPARWPTVLADAAAVADSWAAKALALGWAVSDLFGASINGDPFADGLVAWLGGRKLLMLTEGWAVAADAHGARHYFNRPRAAGSVLLWKLGRG